MIREAIAIAVAGIDLTEEQAAAAMQEIMSDEATPSQMAALLVALRMKGESVDEITGMARVMRERSLKVEYDGPLLDTCSTGGGSFDPFNISTAAGFVCAGAGVAVAKHGNRGFTSASGSADVLEALGARIELTPQQAATCIALTGFCFVFAQSFHPAMRFVGPTRREIGIRTIFNSLGPLTNPAGAQYQVMGVGDKDLAPKLAETLARLGTGRSFIVHSDDGLDEVSLSAATLVYDVRGDTVASFILTPEDAGLQRAPLEALRTGTTQENAARLQALLRGERGPHRDVVLLNAAAGLLAAGKAASIKDGVALAAAAIDSGKALQVLEDYVRVSSSFEAAP